MKRMRRIFCKNLFKSFQSVQSVFQSPQHNWLSLLIPFPLFPVQSKNQVPRISTVDLQGLTRDAVTPAFFKALQKLAFPFGAGIAEHFGAEQPCHTEFTAILCVGASDTVAAALAVYFSSLEFDGNRDAVRHLLRHVAPGEVGHLPNHAFQSDGRFAFAFSIRGNACTLRRAGIAVGFVVATADGIVLQGADTVGLGVFNTFLGWVAGQCRGKEEEGKEGIFHVLSFLCWTRIKQMEANFICWFVVCAFQ